MRSQTISLVLLLWSAFIFAHENTIYPLIKNAPTKQDQKLEYSIVVDADLNQTKFKFFLHCLKADSKQCHSENLVIKASARMEREPNFEGTAQYNQSESTATKKIYEVTLPLPKTGKWMVDFKVLDGEKLIDQRQMPVEIVPEGPNKVEALTYTLPFVLMLIIGFRVFLVKRGRVQA